MGSKKSVSRKPSTSRFLSRLPIIGAGMDSQQTLVMPLVIDSVSSTTEPLWDFAHLHTEERFPGNISPYASSRSYSYETPPSPESDSYQTAPLATRPTRLAVQDWASLNSFRPPYGMTRVKDLAYTVTQATVSPGGSFKLSFNVYFHGYEELFFWVVTCAYDKTTGLMDTKLEVKKIDPTSTTVQSFNFNVPLDSLKINFYRKNLQSPFDDGNGQNIGWNSTGFLDSAYDFTNFSHLLIDVDLHFEVDEKVQDSSKLLQILIQGHQSS